MGIIHTLDIHMYVWVIPYEPYYHLFIQQLFSKVPWILNRFPREGLLLFLNTGLLNQSTDNLLMILSKLKICLSFRALHQRLPILAKTSALRKSPLVEAVRFLNMIKEDLYPFNCRIDKLDSTRVSLHDLMKKLSKKIFMFTFCRIFLTSQVTVDINCYFIKNHKLD